MAIVSHAQNGEDVVLMRALRHVDGGHYIDVGASDPDDLSVTRLFYDRGWSGINVEPTRAGHERFLLRRPRDLNLNVAVSNRAGVVRLNEVTRDGQATGLSTAIDDVADQARAGSFEVRPTDVAALALADICASKPFEEIHFLKIDVEGAEREVLEGADFLRFRPWIVVVEATIPNTSRRNDDLWRGILEGARYDCCLFDGLNLFFHARERPELGTALSAPANVLDDYVPAALDAATRRLADMDRSAAAAEEAQRRLEGTVRNRTAERDAARAEAADRAQALETQRRAIDAATAGRDAALGEIADLRERLAADAERHAAAATHLGRELRDLQAQVAGLEALRSDSARLHRIAQLLGGSLSTATQNNGLEVMQRSFAARLSAWRAEMTRDQADLRSQLDAALGHHASMSASTSWRLTAPLRRMRHATHVVRREPHRVPGLLMRRLLGRTAEPMAAAPAAAAPAPGPVSSSDAIEVTASRIESELGMISELLQTIAATLEGQIETGVRPAVQPGSDAYRALPFAQKLASWIRFDADRQRRAA